MGNGPRQGKFRGRRFCENSGGQDTDRILGDISSVRWQAISSMRSASQWNSGRRQKTSRAPARTSDYSEAVREAALACGDGAIHS
ncbi:Lpd [Caligus rogercresseyi]|uniref:Lpd n=1 Tax=Caligus rogercresseyi TaxID=217165 RepID=A0A7T8K120_CALRO|nr:Lpd [Caligus rogercresseyi]